MGRPTPRPLGRYLEHLGQGSRTVTVQKLGPRGAPVPIRDANGRTVDYETETATVPVLEGPRGIAVATYVEARRAGNRSARVHGLPDYYVVISLRATGHGVELLRSLAPRLQQEGLVVELLLPPSGTLGILSIFFAP